MEWVYDKEKDKLRIEHRVIGKGMTISLPELIAKYKVRKAPSIDEVVYLIHTTCCAMEKEHGKALQGKEMIYPVICSTSFPKKTAAGHAFVMKEHTAETKIYYALDLGETYRLIDQ